VVTRIPLGLGDPGRGPATDGSLALDDLWLEPAPRRRAPAAASRLKEREPFDTVPPVMPPSRPNRRRRVERREARAARRTRQLALLLLLAAVLVASLLATAFGGGTSRVPVSLAAASLASTQTAAQTRPFPEIVAMRGPVRLQLPVSQRRVTAIGYHSADDGGLPLAPAGRQRNEGLVQRLIHSVFGGGGGSPTWYRLSSGATSALDVGAPVGTNVYAPVDGTVVAITPYVVGGKRYGSRIDIQPQNAPSVVVSLTQLRVDPSLTVGSTVVSGARKLGTVVDLARVERQALARYTNDAGNHVTVELRPAASVVLD
jgi:murein DD-endopeptidase MepM/ murein hydrolase activator NlpD